MKYFALIFLTFVSFSLQISAQQLPFSQKQLSLPQLGYSAIAWGDYERDGDLDIALSGVEGNTPVTKILRNDNGNFTDISADLLPLHYGSVEWGDFDADNDLDLLVTGINSQGDAFTKIYTNANGTFNDSGVILPGVSDGQASWGDYNNDGLLDVLLAGNMKAIIFRNDGNGQFTDICAPLPAVQSPMCCWVDYNNDGEMDVMVCGDTGGGIYTKLFKNSDGVFTEVNITPEPFTGLYGGQAKWADLDNDGDQDLVISGMDLYIDAYLLVYRNDGNDQFTKFTIGSGNMLSGSIDLGDFDSDGLIDLIVMGRTPGCGGNAATVLLQNTGLMNFLPVSSLLPGYKQGGVTWGDYNNDGFSDLLFTGLDGFEVPQTILYLNNLGDTAFAQNTPPTVPAGLGYTMEANRAILHWNSASDAQTPKNGLSYNILIGTQPNLYDVMAPMANAATGSRFVATPGNASADTSWIISGISPGNYYFSIQTIDNGFMPGTFSTPTMFSYQPVGLSDEVNAHLQVYPNPCKNRVYVEVSRLLSSSDGDENKNFTIIILNYQGKMVYQGFNSGEIDVSRLPSGIYLLKIQYGDNVFLRKLVKE